MLGNYYYYYYYYYGLIIAFLIEKEVCIEHKFTLLQTIVRINLFHEISINVKHY